MKQETSDGVTASPFVAAAARAEMLSRTTASAAEPLRFAAGMLRVQAGTAAVLKTIHRTRALCGRAQSDLGRVLTPLKSVLRYAADSGPAPLASVARQRLNERDAISAQRLALFVEGNTDARDDYLSRAALRPYLSLLRTNAVAPERVHERGHCPYCGAAPLVGCRRGASASEGGARFLTCGSCGLEWSFHRIACPACNERDPQKLPTFKSTLHPAARIEACETCRRYMKSIDIDADAGAIPEVDDLASLALDLWAVKQGFTRIEPGLAGL